MNILSIDVAITKPTAYALFLFSDLAEHGKADGISQLVEMMSLHDLDLIATEDMYHKQNVDTLKKLCYEVGKVIYIADTYGIKYRLIRPVDWKNHHGLTGINPEYVNIVQKKIVLSETCVETDDDDIQAAILIGLYVIERARMGYDD